MNGLTLSEELAKVPETEVLPGVFIQDFRSTSTTSDLASFPEPNVETNDAGRPLVIGVLKF